MLIIIRAWITLDVLASEFEFHHAPRRPLPGDTFYRLLQCYMV
jgi:hypothetical protein